MNVVFYLATCDTCKRILKQLQLPENIVYRELKSQPISEEELDRLFLFSKSYESLFNKRAKLYQEYGLKEQKLFETDYKKYLLEHFTFLNRPVFLFQDKIFIGNSPKNIQSLETFLTSEF
jgi:arsenate reductase-like glutaredoxin family protein